MPEMQRAARPLLLNAVSFASVASNRAAAVTAPAEPLGVVIDAPSPADEAGAKKTSFLSSSTFTNLFSSSSYSFDLRSTSELYEAAAAVSTASLAQLGSQSSLPWATLRLALDAFRVSVRRAEDYYGAQGAQGVLSLDNYAQLLVGLGELAALCRRRRRDDWHVRETPADRAAVERLAAYAPIAHAAYKVRSTPHHIESTGSWLLLLILVLTASLFVVSFSAGHCRWRRTCVRGRRLRRHGASR
jgi:hypothetical protein